LNKLRKGKLPPCLILAGGKGRRLGSITKKIPKPIVSINNKPFIKYQLEWLISYGFTNFKFIVAYKKKKLIKVLEHFFYNKKHKFEILEDNSTGTFNAVLKNFKKLDNEFFYSNADEISPFKIKDMYKKFKKNKSDIMCATLKSKDGNLVILNKNLKLAENNSLKKELYKDCGYKFIKKKIFRKVNKKKFQKIENFIYHEYSKFKPVGYFKIKNLPFRIDTPNDIKRTKFFLKRLKIN
jgi:NDP-sugar pyrophosphorylase family protein